MMSPTYDIKPGESMGKLSNHMERIPLHGEIIVVTGGSGFLGQHIVRALNERADGVKEIRVVDLIPYVQKLPFNKKHPMNFFRADISKSGELNLPFQDATAVIHSAAAVDIGFCVDKQKLHRINVLGTTNVVNKCLEWSIGKLILTSTADVLIPKRGMEEGSSGRDLNLPKNEDECLLGCYAFTKAQAEEIVRNGRNTQMKNGKFLKTVTLRLTNLYGELDVHTIPGVLKGAKMAGGYFPQPKCKVKSDHEYQVVYAGNAAWAHVLGIWKLTEEIRPTHPKEYEVFRKSEWNTFIVMDESAKSFYSFIQPFFALKGYSLQNVPLSLASFTRFVSLQSLLIRLLPFRWKSRPLPLLPTVEIYKRVHTSLNNYSDTEIMDSLFGGHIYGKEKATELSSRYYLSISM